MRHSDAERLTAQIVVIGSGAGGAITAATLAEAGLSVLLLEEGPEVDTGTMATHTPEAMRSLYRNGGLSPILGNTNIAFLEGRCVGGSTEINAAFWHRPPPDAVERWGALTTVRDLRSEDLNKLCEEIESELSVSRLNSHPPASSEVLKRGAERLGWSVAEIPRAQPATLTCSQFAPGAKRSMSRSYIPRALRAGAKCLSNCRAIRLQHQNGRVISVTAHNTSGDQHWLRIEAETFFVCGGAIQTPVLLRASGITRNVGDNLRLHPMLKAAAEFGEPLDSHLTTLPIYQITEFWPDITIGGSVFTPGYLALTLSENWAENQTAMREWRNMALYYTACRGTSCGSVRVFPGTQEAIVRYQLPKADQVNLSTGMSRLCEVLFAAGARRVYPGVRGYAAFTSMAESQRFLKMSIPISQMSISTVHVFGTCPMGENRDVCATDSFGRVHGFQNLYIADASLIPDSPGVNPQGTVMALALRNARHFLNTQA